LFIEANKHFELVKKYKMEFSIKVNNELLLFKQTDYRNETFPFKMRASEY